MPYQLIIDKDSGKVKIPLQSISFEIQTVIRENIKPNLLTDFLKEFTLDIARKKKPPPRFKIINKRPKPKPKSKRLPTFKLKQSTKQPALLDEPSPKTKTLPKSGTKLRREFKITNN